jgi:photosystem II stability/assembly factor-like uncharacterized protein
MHQSSYYRHCCTRAALIVLLIVCVLVPCMAGARQKLFDDLFSVSFPDEQTGWACGRWGAVLHTADGGKTWVTQNTGTDYTLSSLHFVDSKTGWAVGDGGTIIATRDGGTTWESQKSPVPYFLMGVHFVSPLKGFIVTERTHILVTENGGKTWTKQFSDADYILKSVSFADELNGWTVGEYGYIYHTSDGGKTWDKQGGGFGLNQDTGEVEGGIFLFAVAAVDQKTAWAVGIDGHVTKTVDGGKTWTPVKAGAAKTQLYGVAVNRAGAIAIAGNGTALYSPDKGKSWRQPDCTPSISYSWLYGISPVAQSGFAAVGSQSAIYTGSGSSWRMVEY